MAQEAAEVKAEIQRIANAVIEELQARIPALSDDEETLRSQVSDFVVNLETLIGEMEEIANISIPRPTREFFKTGS